LPPTTCKANAMLSLKRFPFHFILLLLFFLSHGYSENIGLIPFKDLLIYFLTGTAVALLIFFLMKKITRSGLKAGIVTTLMLLFYLFYGSIKDNLKAGFLAPLAKYSVLLPLMLVIVIATIIYFRKTSRQFVRLTFFINCLLLVYLLVDAGTIVTKVAKRAGPVVPVAQNIYTICDTCRRPDVYLIIMDEYSGDRILRDYFKYDNSSFAAQLRQRGFYVPSAPFSNYSATPVSIASIFAMDYLPEFHRKLVAEDYTRSEKVVEKSITMQLLKDHGYRFMNHSIFNIAAQPGQFKTDLLPMRLKLITAKTLWNSAMADIGWQIHEKIAPHVNWLGETLQDDYKTGNQRLLQLTENAYLENDSVPRFIYTHVLMPHWPYLFDSTGKETGINFYSKAITGKQKEASYVQYLAYTNKVMLRMVDEIVVFSKGKAIIVLMSDHGFREKPGTQACLDVNNNFISVYLPWRNYGLFYDSISNVNVMRTVFNSAFDQRFPRLPDKCIF
jgi:hypothetical protein